MNRSGSTAIVWPMFALAAWTMLVLLRVAWLRIAAVRRGDVTPDHFRLGEAPQVPSAASIANRNYMNLLEMPLLFHVGALLAYVTAAATPGVVTAAWTYVALRVAHSVVHLGANVVVVRLVVFAASNAVLAAMWVLIGLAIAQAPGA